MDRHPIDSQQGGDPMSLPYLIVVTGEPGAGKSTFAEALSREACLPLLSRDRIKEGCVHTWGLSAKELPPDANLRATNLFFETMGSLLEGGCSLIAEAAFQHPLWSQRLTPWLNRARIRLCLCAPESREIAHERFLRRGLADRRRGHYHGDRGVELARQGLAVDFADYAPPRLPVPTFRIDTTGEYDPPLSVLIEQLFQAEEM